MKRNMKRLTAAILAALMILIVLLFAGTVILEATHDCDGAACRVCDIIHTLSSILCGLGATLFILLSGSVIRYKNEFRQQTASPVPSATPVTDKVLMLN